MSINYKVKNDTIYCELNEGSHFTNKNSLKNIHGSVYYVLLLDSEAVYAYRSVVAKEEYENPCKYFKKVKMLIHHVFIHSSNLPSLLNRTKGQLKFPARGEELALERVVEVVVHAKQQIRIVTQTVSVADVPAMK